MNYQDLLKQVMSKCKEDGLEAGFDYIDKYIEENPNSCEGYLVRSEMDTEAGAFESALADTEKAIKINPWEAAAYNNRGRIYVISGGGHNLQEDVINKALSDFNKAIELNPNYPDAYCNRANIYLKKRDIQNAINDCTKAIELSPENIEPYHNRGLAYMNTGEMAKAFDDYNMIIKLAPDSAEAYSRRGFLNSQLGNKQEAIRDYEEFLRLDPNNQNAGLVKGELKKLQGGCYIATAVYGSYDAPEVLYLRQFRDETLSASIFGRLFIRFYYFFSPPIAEHLKNARHLNTVVRKILDKFVCKKENNYVA